MEEEKTKEQRIADNAKLLERYPILRPPFPEGDEGYEGDWTMLDLVCLGWQKIFLEACDEIMEHLKEDGTNIKDAHFYDVKEKYGILRAEFYPSDDEIDEIVSRLEERSMLFCPSCGKPTKYVTKGYVLYVCEDCAKEVKMEKQPLTAADIPYYTIYESGGNGDAEAKKTRKPAYYQREFEKQWI